MNTKITDAAVEAALQAFIASDDTLETDLRAALEAAQPHMQPSAVEGIRGKVIEVAYGGFATIEVDCSHIGPHMLSKGGTFTLINDKADLAATGTQQAGEVQGSND